MANEPQYRAAKDLVETIGDKNVYQFLSEYVVEWEIRAEAIEHSVTLQALIARGLYQFLGWDNTKGGTGRIFGSTQDLRDAIGRSLFNGNQNPFEIRLQLGRMTRIFGARAPLKRIAKEILDKIVKSGVNIEFIDISVRYELAKNVLTDIPD